MSEEEEGVFGQRVIRHGEGDERLGWEGWLILFGLGVGVVPAAMFLPAFGLDPAASSPALPVLSTPAPPFDPLQLMVGLLLAAGLLAGALWLVLRTDWVDSD